MREDYTINIK